MELSNCQIDNQALKELLKNDFSNLEKLILSKSLNKIDGNRIGCSGCKAIAETNTLNNLLTLELDGNNIRDAGAT